jgi:acyl-homoserine lactone acylase PvdQ
MLLSAGRFRAVLCAATILVLGTQVQNAWGQTATDHSSPGAAFNILPPGQAGGFLFNTNSRDQIPLYDGLTPLQDNVSAADLPQYFKPNVFGLGGLSLQRTQTFPSRPGLVVRRDSFSVPHIDAQNRDDAMYAVGFVTAEDRTLLMDTLRGPGRAAVVDAPGLNPFALAQSFQPFVPSQQTEDFLAQQVDLVLAEPGGQRIIDDVDQYLQGINDFRAQAGVTGRPWNRNDVVAVAALIGAVFGKGGGDEARRAQLLSALQDRLGQHQGEQVWNDLRQQNDLETSVSVPGKFRLTHPRPNQNGNAVIDAASLDTNAAQSSAVAQASQASASNALLVGAERSATGHPFFVAGPQVGYFYPGVLYEVDVHGGGIDARGATFPGSGPYVQLGRGQDFSWSATSAGNDNIDIFAEELCGDDTHYRFEGECREMTTFDAGRVGFGAGTPVVFNETVHGPVIGYATVDGERVALSSARSTRNREVVSAFGFADLNENKPTDAQSFFDSVNKIEFTFNWFYADDDEVAMFSSGRLPVRHPQVDLGLPTKGTGKYEWRGFLAQDKHPQGSALTTGPGAGTILNWNNKPARNWQAADDNWIYGSVHRNELLVAAIDRQQTHTLASTVGAMNRAATQDLRITQAFRGIAAVVGGTQAPSARAQEMYDLLIDWRDEGGSRLDRDLDGTIDHPGAAILDKAWSKLADAVMEPVLGPELDDLASLVGRDNRANNQGSSYGGGWYSYVEKDLRALAGRFVAGPFKTRFCGLGDITVCRASLWAAIEQAGVELEDELANPNPADWRADAAAERIFFSPGFLSDTMRWTNRPTFQQAITYSSHR